jgi:hypothetical protein
MKDILQQAKSTVERSTKIAACNSLFDHMHQLQKMLGLNSADCIDVLVKTTMAFAATCAKKGEVASVMDLVTEMAAREAAHMKKCPPPPDED